MSKVDFETLAHFRYQLRRYLRFSEDLTQRAGITPLQYLLMLQIKGFPGRESANVGELAERLGGSEEDGVVAFGVPVAGHHVVGPAVHVHAQLGVEAHELTDDDERHVDGELLDEVESVLKIKCAPVTWPIGMGRDFKGVYHLIENRIYLYQPGHGSELIADKVIEGLDNPELDAAIGDEAANLRDSLARLKAEEDEAQGQLFTDPDQMRQWRRDIDAMSRRLDELDDEEAREIAAITDRYADVKPHTTAAAVVFALTRADADGWVE